MENGALFSHVGGKDTRRHIYDPPPPKFHLIPKSPAELVD